MLCRAILKKGKNDLQHSKTYTLKFIVFITIVVSLLLSLADTQLKDRHKTNIEIDRKKNILESLGLDMKKYSPDEIKSEYEKRIKGIVISLDGNIIENINPRNLLLQENKVTGQSNYYNEAMQEYLPVYYSAEPKAYIFPISGKGLWSTLFGYLSLENDFNTIKGISFYKHKETAGLGGEVDKKWFRNNFIGKTIFNKSGQLISISLVKGKVENVISEDKWSYYVDGISGATITSKGVTTFLKRDLLRYQPFFNKILAQ